MSNPLRGRPVLVPSTIILAHSSAAASSKARMRPSKSARGPSAPLNQPSSSCLFRPGGAARMPRLISASVNVAMKSSERGCSFSHSSKAGEGCGLVAWLMMFVSRRYLVKGRSHARTQSDARFPSPVRPMEIVAVPQQYLRAATPVPLFFRSVLFVTVWLRHHLPRACAQHVGRVPYRV